MVYRVRFSLHQAVWKLVISIRTFSSLEELPSPRYMNYRPFAVLTQLISTTIGQLRFFCLHRACPVASVYCPVNLSNTSATESCLSAEITSIGVIRNKEILVSVTRHRDSILYYLCENGLTWTAYAISR